MDSVLNGVVSNTVLAGVLALFTSGIQRFWHNPQLAHALWFLVLAKLITPPLFSVALPDHRLFSVSRAAAPILADDVDTLQRPGDGDLSLAPTMSRPEPMHQEGGPIRVMVDSTTEPAEVTPMSTSRRQASLVSSLAILIAANWQTWLCATWGAGLIVGAIIHWRQLGRFRTLFSAAVDADAELLDDTRMFAKRMGLQSYPSIRVLHAHFPPLVCAGWRRHLLLMPARLLRELDREQLHTVLVHELAHIRRGDHLMRWFEILVRGVFWWHPLAWWASHQLRQAEEECCDAWVVWALPNGQRSYGKALLWTVQFLAERRVVPVVVGAAFGGSHVKRRIEMVMTRKLNRKMSWGALFMVVISAFCVLPVAAQKRPDNDAVGRGLAEREPETEATQAPTSAAESRDLEARIERLERLLQELTLTVKNSATNSRDEQQGNRGKASDQRGVRDVELRRGTDAKGAEQMPTRDWKEWSARNNRLKETLLALDKQAWDAASTRDWKAYEKLVRPGYNWGYFGTSRNAPTVEELQRRRYFDVKIREVEVGKITEDVAFLKYVFSCKVEEAEQVQTYQNHQSMQIWTLIDGNWLLTYTTNFVLMGGE
ncbi:M56 family metallopeptidase [Schlesneria paludicola]|uniref:M56 family metallopeptidase n=1 Tax=Schlesneria paludicola TaxID=360056 RepID=UPI00029A26A3|nr:M56 family metallopeptidase [Schlesneria paludicola]